MPAAPAGPINYDDYRTVMPIPVSEINVSNGKPETKRRLLIH